MSFAIVCHGCGVPLNIPDDYPRNKMQCPECGVMCQVPPRPTAKKKAEPKKPAEDAPRFEDDEPAAPVRSAPPPPMTTIVKEPAPVAKGLVTCPHCGEMVRAPSRKRGQAGKCPVCAAAWPAPTAPAKPVLPPLPVPPPPDEFAGSTPDEDPETSNPYRTADAGSRRCPGCTAYLGPEVVVCVRCGFDLRTGRKVIKEYQKLERSWDCGMPWRTRIILFPLSQLLPVLAVGAGLLTLEDSLAVALPTIGVAWLVYTAMLAFLLGTFDHFELKRHKSGRVDLYRTWRFAFIRRPTTRIDVRDYSGVANGATYTSFIEWFVFLVLFGFGIIPGLICWYYVIYKTEYTVALTKIEGVPEIYVYRGWKQEEMLEIKQTLCDAMTV